MSSTQRIRLLRAASADKTGSEPELELLPSTEQLAVRRLTPLCTALGAMLVAGAILRYVALSLNPEQLEREGYLIGGTVHFLVLAMISFGMAAFARRCPRSSQVVAVGLVYEVALCFGVGLLDHMLFDLYEMPPRLSFIAVGLLTFPIALPTTPRRRTVTTLLCAAMLPLSGLAAWLLLDQPKPPPTPFPYAPTLLCAGVALFVSRAVHQLSEQAQQARRLGSYELIERIGGGGMGDVWLARHRRLVRPAAIKLINPDVLGSSLAEARRRFDREARATSALRSPHTVALYDYGVAQDGVFYYAMELLDGIDLRRFVDQFGPMSPARAVHVLAQMCLSLAEAHDSGFVHRDIKPANILLCRQGSHHDFVKVLDFGLVKDLTADENDATDDGTARGTPAFMAPETVEGNTVDGRADLYAVGCVAYWLVAGRYVFEARTAMALAMHHVQTPPRPLSQFVEGISESLDAVVLSCLAKDPADRPQSAHELREALAGLDLAAAWTEDDARAWWRDNAEQIGAARKEAAQEAVSGTDPTELARTVRDATAETAAARK